MINSKMWLDTDISNQPPNTNRECYNINNFIKLGSITQELSTKIVSVYNKQPLFILPINNDDIVLFNLDNTIGIINDDVYTQKYSSSLLGFTGSTVLNCDYYTNNLGERIIIFVYNLGNKQINIDTGVVENLINTALEPIITTTINDYGNLQVGSYKLFLRYVNNDKSVTNFFKSYDPIIITDNKESGTVTNKSIRLSINGINLGYKYLELGYVHVKDGVQTAYIIKKFDVKSTIIYTIVENSNKEPISLDELINDNVVYKNINNIKIAKNYLYGYGVKFYKEAANLQTLTNALTLKCLSTLQTPTRTTNIKTFAHGEVYSFYIRYKFTWGYSRWYLLIGRTAKSEERDTVTKNLKAYYKYEVEDTCSIITSDTINNKTLCDFSFWENQEEDYPLDYNLPVGKIRHFKFPTVNWMRNNVYNYSSYGTTTFDSLGVKLDNVDLSLIKDNNDVAAYDYELGYAKRTPYNSLVVGQSIIIFNNKNESSIDSNFTEGKDFSNGGNFRTSYNGDKSYQNSKSLRTYPLEILVNQNDISIDAFREDLFLETYPINSDIDKDSNPLFDTYKMSLIKSDFYSTAQSSPINNSLNAAYHNNITSSKIILNNTIKDDINNLYSESFYSIKGSSFFGSLVENDSAMVAGKKVINTPFISGKEFTKLITLLKENKNCYEDVLNQDIVTVRKNSDDVFTNGDVYINITDVVLLGTYVGAYREPVQTSEDSDKQGLFEGNICIKTFISESIYNTNSIKDTVVPHYPRVSLFPIIYYATIKRDLDPNLFNLSINKDFTIFNDLTFSKLTKDVETVDSDYYIVRSGNIENNNIFNIREFSKDDVYIVPKNKGKVINIEEGQDFLYVHTETTLFRTVGSNKAAVDNTDNLLYLKVGDIFQTPLFEIQHSDLGLMGTQHKFSCFLCEYGYGFIDAGKNKMFLIGDKGIKVLSSDGLINKFKELLSTSYVSSPFIGEGVSVEFDDYTERLFVVIGNTCLLYSFINQGWLCFTTYIPDFVFKTRKYFYSLKDNKIYKHNELRRNNVVYGNKIDSIANVILPTIDKNQNHYLINGVSFKNDVFDALRFKNSYQDTGEVELFEISNAETIENINGNVRKFQGDYLFYMIRDYCTDLGLQDSFVSIDVIMRGTEPKELSEIVIL